MSLKDLAAGALDILDDPDKPASNTDCHGKATSAVPMSLQAGESEEYATAIRPVMAMTPHNEVASEAARGDAAAAAHAELVTDAFGQGHRSPTVPNSVAKKYAGISSSNANQTGHSQSTNTSDKRVVRKSGKYRKHSPWSEEDEEVLRHAFKDVECKKWNDVIKRYGDGGTVNESLKGRDWMNLYNKGRLVKAEMLRRGEEVPPILATQRIKRRRQEEEAEDADYYETTVRRSKRERRATARLQEAGESAEDGEETPDERQAENHDEQKKNDNVKTETIELSDGSDDERIKNELDLSEKGPKKQQQRSQQRARGAVTEDKAEQEYEMMELELRMRKATTAAAEAKREEMDLELKMLKLKHQRGVQH